MAFVLTGGRVWNGLAEASAAADVAVADGLIVERAPADAREIDVRGCTVLPGLIEGHAHLCFNAEPEWRAVYDADTPARMLLRMAAHARAMLRAGITTVRDLGAPTALAVELRDAARAGLVESPDLLVAGAPLTTTGGHCWFLGGEADGELAVRVTVRERVRAGVDWIKVMASGGNMTPGSNPMRAQYTVEEVAAAVEEAHRLGVRVAAHCHGVEGIRVAVAAGADTLEHCSFQTPDGSAKDDAVIAEIAAKGLIVSPTVSVGLARQAGTDRWQSRAALLRALFAAGCRVVMSTDCGIPNVPHGALAAGMRALADAGGCSPVEVLRLATSTSADLLGLPDRGRIAAGRRADLLVVEGDPTVDLGALERVRVVIANGRVVHRSG
ncbi:MAG: amidohydrolase family protein [Chloroflexi bacterium]|nr:amidohydrolase family protein [Chloroflexota bacterium]